MNTKLSMRIPWASTLFIAGVLFFGQRPACAQFTAATPAQVDAVSETAGATILIPYFEVDLSNPNGRNTIFTIDHTGRLDFFNGNISNNLATAILTHVTVWSDLGVPVFNFNVYLTGYDVETVNMRSVLTGTLPRTASAGQDPTGLISPKGTLAQDINFASCAGQLPPAPLSAAQLANLANSLTGKPSAAQGGKCGGRNLGDNVARGYVTVDVVNNCTTRNPGDTGYFGANFSGDVTNQNTITGQVLYIDPSTNTTRGTNVVHIHAEPNGAVPPSGTLTTTPGNYTFYGRLDGFSAADNRQPLSTTFAARYNPGNTASPAPTSSLIVWRDPKMPQGYFTCGTTPAWYPLGQEGIVAFDEQEHIQAINGSIPFPAVTQLVPIGGSTLPVTAGAGWLWLNLNTTVAPAGSVPATDPAAAQAWVQIVDGKYGVLHNAQQLDSATSASHVTP